VLERHRGLSRKAATPIAREMLEKVGIPDPARRLTDYPHQLSGGMRQRALIAIALAAQPRVLIADEPTTALDVTIQAQILALLKELVEDTGTALIMITHDLGVVAGLVDRVNVLYAGKIVERGDRHELFAEPRHPYTWGLLNSIPRLDGARGERLNPIPGSVADNLPWASACAFAPRCSQPVQVCREEQPKLVEEGTRALRCFNPIDDAVRRGEQPPTDATCAASPADTAHPTADPTTEETR
jgi:peptide/nickel transport system ATP-binding protein